MALWIQCGFPFKVRCVGPGQLREIFLGLGFLFFLLLPLPQPLRGCSEGRTF